VHVVIYKLPPTPPGPISRAVYESVSCHAMLWAVMYYWHPPHARADRDRYLFVRYKDRPKKPCANPQCGQHAGDNSKYCRYIVPWIAGPFASYSMVQQQVLQISRAMDNGRCSLVRLFASCLSGFHSKAANASETEHQRKCLKRPKCASAHFLFQPQVRPCQGSRPREGSHSPCQPIVRVRPGPGPGCGCGRPTRVFQAQADRRSQGEPREVRRLCCRIAPMLGISSSSVRSKP
jgi:hypothetical protein